MRFTNLVIGTAKQLMLNLFESLKQYALMLPDTAVPFIDEFIESAMYMQFSLH